MITKSRPKCFFCNSGVPPQTGKGGKASDWKKGDSHSGGYAVKGGKGDGAWKNKSGANVDKDDEGGWGKESGGNKGWGKGGKDSGKDGGKDGTGKDWGKDGRKQCFFLQINDFFSSALLTSFALSKWFP